MELLEELFFRRDEMERNFFPKYVLSKITDEIDTIITEGMHKRRV